ncbi:hypothetical protein EDC04DRAFT_2581428 [Pisolithus marmoratus]|nr:hypothetical protein EDC04DRAFT_2581428 [Pisolithus marmoratus]
MNQRHVRSSGLLSAACALQNCLSVNTYSPDKCDKFVKALYLCCNEMYRRDGKDATSSACPMRSVVERWLRRHTDIDPRR